MDVCLEQSRSLHKHLQIPEAKFSEMTPATRIPAVATDPVGRVLLINLSYLTDGGMNRILE